MLEVEYKYPGAEPALGMDKLVVVWGKSVSSGKSMVVINQGNSIGWSKYWPCLCLAFTGSGVLTEQMEECRNHSLSGPK